MGQSRKQTQRRVAWNATPGCGETTASGARCEETVAGRGKTTMHGKASPPPFMLLIHFGVAITFNRYILAVAGLSMV